MLVLIGSKEIFAQHSFSFNNGPAMSKYQDTLIRLSQETISATDPATKLSRNAAFIKTLVNALKTHTSYAFPFDSLKTINIVKSPDNLFRIFSWHIPVDDGYRFFGTIQMATKDGSLKMIPLIDGTDDFTDPNVITDSKKWFGAQYYEIVPVPNGKQPYYVLLGWKGNNQKSTKKVLEVLSFQNNEVTLGKPVFEGVKGGNTKNRIVFEYNKSNSMTLTMDKSVNMIVFDHLAPMSEEMLGNYEYYASDLSFDAYKINNGRLRLVENIELKNDPNDMDDFYTDPNDKSIKAVKKL